VTANISGIAALFPPKAVAQASSASFSDLMTIRGAFPYDAIRAAGFPLAPLLIGVVETVRADPHWGPIYRGDLSVHGYDHSAADLALCGEFARLGLPGPVIDTAMRTSALYRGKWERDDYRSRTIGLALGGKSNPASSDLLAQENGRVDAGNIPPPPRDWLVQDMLLMGKSAILAGLSGVAKSQLTTQLAMAVAAGDSFAGRSTKEGQVLFLSGEEDRAELLRRINAVIRHFGLPQPQIDLVRQNLFAFPLVGEDIRFTAGKSGALAEAKFVNQVIEAAKEHEAVHLIILDHAGLVHGGNFSDKHDVALTMRIVNRVCQATGAAVLLVAHSPKSAINAQEPDASMIFGSTAFVEQARGGWVMTTMTEVQAKHFGIGKAGRSDFVAMTGVKANYTKAGQEFWFRKVPFDEVAVLEHVTLSPKQAQAKQTVTLQGHILQAVTSSPGRYSKTNLRDQHHGKTKGPWAASKGEIESAIDDMLKAGQLVNRSPTAADVTTYGHGPQVKMVLDVPVPQPPVAP
jgi:AAA domain